MGFPSHLEVGFQGLEWGFLDHLEMDFEGLEFGFPSCLEVGFQGLKIGFLSCFEEGLEGSGWWCLRYLEGVLEDGFGIGDSGFVEEWSYCCWVGERGAENRIPWLPGGKGGRVVFVSAIGGED